MTAVSEEKRMQQPLRRLLRILRRHPCRAKAIALSCLYEEWADYTFERNAQGRITENVPNKTRHMRDLINELIDVHGIPVMSSSASGYWIVSNQDELQDVCREFHARGVRSLKKAARLANVSLIETVQQLALELEDSTSTLNRQFVAPEAGRPEADMMLGPEVKMAVITKHLQELIENPDEYADQIAALQREFGPKLLPQSVLDSVHAQIAKVRRAADCLERMVGTGG